MVKPGRGLHCIKPPLCGGGLLVICDISQTKSQIYVMSPRTGDQAFVGSSSSNKVRNNLEQVIPTPFLTASEIKTILQYKNVRYLKFNFRN